MSGALETRRLTNPSLHIRGRVDGDDVQRSSSWLDALLGLLRCSSRRKQWRRCSSEKSACLVPLDYKKDPLELNFSWLSSSAVSDSFKVLLIFPRDDDQQSEIIGRVARKLGWSISEARNAEEAEELARDHDLAIVDRRGSTARSQDADEICRRLTTSEDTKHCSIIALVKKSFFTAPHSDETTILQLLNLGYKRALLECSHEGILMNELIGIHASECQPKSQLSAAHVLFLAVDRFRDIVHVTNDQHIIQFANRASEKYLGYSSEDLVGRKIDEFMTNAHSELMEQQLQKGFEFEGSVSWRRKNKSIIAISCKVSPITVPASKATFYAYLYDRTTYLQSSSSATSFQQISSRGSVGQFSRQNSELWATNKPRRTVAAKLHNMLLEAPITKVVTLLSAAVQDSETPEVSSQIEKAIELLKSIELYSPHLRDESLSVSDPITADLLEALICIPTSDPRKSSNASLSRSSAIIRILNSTRTHNAKLMKSPHGPPELQELLDNCFEWNFDIFKLETITNGRPLFFLGMALMEHFRIAERLDCDERTIQNWLTIIEANYHSNIAYHNSTHATDVLQAVSRFLRSERLRMVLDPMDEIAALIAAATHDLGHPGKSSQFLCNENHKLAILYNDLTVLESHHSALTFKVTLSDDNVNIFKNLNRDMYKLIRQNIIDMILATEMTKHFEHLAKFVNICSSRSNETDDEAFAEDMADVFLHPENVTLTKRMMIKCADVSNPTRPFRLYVEWTRRIAEEYFDQTDEEKKRNLPVLMPMFDRISCSIPKSQIGFVDFIINDMMEAWDTFIDMPELIGNMRENYERWKELCEQGVTTLEDIKELQKIPELQLYRKEAEG